MTTSQLTTAERQQAEEAYRQAIGLVRSLARLLGYPCPIVSRQERRNPVHQAIDDMCYTKISERAYPDEEATSGHA